MESGQRKDDKGAIIPAHFITQLEIRHGERLVFGAEFGPSVSANPFLRFRFKGAAAGDRLVARWVDSRGESRSDEVRSPEPPWVQVRSLSANFTVCCFIGFFSG